MISTNLHKITPVRTGLITLLQCFDTVGWVIRPVKTVGRINTVLAQT